jgi:hypothetical protein
MDEIEINETSIPEESTGLLLLQDGQFYLAQAGKWARFLGIMAFISSGLIAIVGLFFGTVMTALSRYQPRAMPTVFGGAMGFFYLLIAVIYFFVGLYLYQFGTRIKTAINTADSVELSQALGKLKSFFNFLGVITIVCIALYALIIIVAIIGFSMVFPGKLT